MQKITIDKPAVPLNIRVVTSICLVVFFQYAFDCFIFLSPKSVFEGNSVCEIYLTQMMLLLILTAILWWMVLLVSFFIWVYRASENKCYLADDHTKLISPPMALLYLIIPVINFYKPYYVFKEIWFTANSETPSLSKISTRLILFGWIFYLVFTIIKFVLFIGLGSNDIDVFLIFIKPMYMAGVVLYLFIMYLFLALSNDQLRALAKKEGTNFKPLRFPWKSCLLLLVIYWGIVISDSKLPKNEEADENSIIEQAEGIKPDDEK